MKKSKFTEAQIIFAIKQSETGVKVEEVCRKMGISDATFYNWKKKYGGLGVTGLRKLRQLEEENYQLKKLVAYPWFNSFKAGGWFWFPSITRSNTPLLICLSSSLTLYFSCTLSRK